MFNELKFFSVNENDLIELKNLEYCIYKLCFKYKVIFFDIKRYSCGKCDKEFCVEYFFFFFI